MKTETLRLLVIGVLLVAVFAPPLLLRPVSTDAMLIPADPSIAQGQPSSLQRQDDLQKIQGVLEAKVIRQRLADLGVLSR